eukprot:791084-Heterocapsa_arctica.AAC.1
MALMGRYNYPDFLYSSLKLQLQIVKQKQQQNIIGRHHMTTTTTTTLFLRGAEARWMILAVACPLSWLSCELSYPPWALRSLGNNIF